LPSSLDFDNAIKLADDALDAARVSETNKAERIYNERRYDSMEEIVEFPNAGISIYRSSNRVVYIGYRLGGCVIVYARGDDGSWQLIHEDSGYILYTKGRKEVWLTRMPDSGTQVDSSKRGLLVCSQFYRSLHDELTTIRLILLRILNLTFLRWNWVGDLFRKIIVNRIVSKRKTIQVKLFREIRIRSESVLVSDRIVDERLPLAASSQGILYRCRRMSGTHMASSRYFQIHELQYLALNWMEEVPWGGKREASHVIEVPSSNP
jgi:hypothetical protein